MEKMKKLCIYLCTIAFVGLMLLGCSNPGMYSYKTKSKNQTGSYSNVKKSLPGPVNDYGMLQVKNGQLCAAEDKGGMPIQLRGMSLYWSMWGQQWWNESAIDQAVDYLGCQIIRAPLGIGDADNPTKTGGYLGGKDSDKAINKARVETVVNEAIYRGIYVIIDWHDSHAEDHTAAAVEFFKQMVDEYKNVPNVLFEIYNEPVSDWDTKIKPYAETVIKAIRDEGGNNVIIVGTPNWSQLGSSVKKNQITDQQNIAYTLHFYAAYGPHQFGGSLGQAAKDAISSPNPMCVFVTEWGTCLNDGAGNVDPSHSQEWVDWMKDNKISWCNWALDDTDEAASMFKVNANTYGPWSDSDLRDSGNYLLHGTDGKEPPLPVPTTSFVVSPSLLRLKGDGKDGNSTNVIKGSLSGATSDQSWLHVNTSGQTINVTADINGSTTDDRSGNITLTDGNGHFAKVKVVQLRNNGDLALMQPTYASSQEGSYRATNATDGDETNTRWGSKFTNGKRIPSEDFQWVTVDLGKSRSFGKITLFWEAAYASHYLIETANDQGNNDVPDNSKFSLLYDSGMISDGKGPHTDTINSGRTARWVRMRSLARTYISGNQYGVSLYEFEIFKVPGIGIWGGDETVYAGASTQGLETWANVAWTANSTVDWLTVDPSTGGSDEDPPFYEHPTLKIADNMTGSVRSGSFTLQGGGATSKTITINQPAETRSYIASTTGGGTIEIKLDPQIGSQSTNDPTTGMDITINANCNFSGWNTTVVTGTDWLTVSSNTSSTVTLHALPNTGSERTALVILKTNTYPCLAVVWVTQPTSASQDIWSPPSGGGQKLVIIPRTGNWTAASSNTGWLTVTPASGSGNASLTVTAGANNTGLTRSATITVTGGGTTKTIQVTQVTQPATFLTINPLSISVAGSGGTKSFTITSNTIWWSAYTTDGGGWLSINTGSYSGAGNGTVYFTLSKNTTGKARTATITVIGGNVPNQIVTITQAAY